MTQKDARFQADISAGRFWRAFLTIGILSFGGPAGQIATMHRELIEKRRWFDEAMFLGALNFCMLLPGPEAQQLATWCGWRLRGIGGGLIAGMLFILPGAVVMAGLAWIYIGFGAQPVVSGVFAGVQAAVVAVVAQAVRRLAGRTLRTRAAWMLAGVAFVLITLFGVPFPAIIAVAAAIGGVAGGALGAPAAHGPAVASPAPANDAANDAGGDAGGNIGAQRAPPRWRTAAITLLVGVALWLTPLLLLSAWLGSDHGLVDVGQFFAKLAAASFGGAYAGLAYVAQGAAGHGWVTPSEIIDGLALAETTPGPLVLTYQFVGALAGHRIPGPWTPWAPGAGAAIGMVLVLWMTFAPSFTLVLALAPQFDRLLAQPRLARALQGVTAAVVGVVASLGLWFALHVLFKSVAVTALGPLQLWLPGGPIDGWAVGIAAGALLLLGRLGMLPVLGLAALAGLAHWFFLNNS